MSSSSHSSTTDCFDQIVQTIQDRKTWECSLLFNVEQDVTSEPTIVDLTSAMQSSQDYVFPSHFNGIDNKNRLSITLRVAAMKSGFMIVQRTCKSTKQLQSKHLAYITLCCQHGLIFQRNRPTKNSRSCKTKYATDPECLCPFRMNISLCKNTDAWYLHSIK